MGHATKALKRHTAQPTEVPACTLLALAPPGVFIFAELDCSSLELE
jgi:hypothetical protein